MGGALMFDKNEIRKRREMKRAWEDRERSEARRKARKPRKSLVVGRIPEDFLRKAYLSDKKSMREIAVLCSCSEHKVAYWITAYSIPVRSQSEAVYGAKHKNGDPFSFNWKDVNTTNPHFLYGLGLGLYSGLGTKVGNDVRIGSSNPAVITAFTNFLCVVCGVKKEALRFGLQVHGTENKIDTLSFWAKSLSVSQKQFQKPVVVRVKKGGVRKMRGTHGFVTLHFYNSKLKQEIIKAIKNAH